MRYVDRSLSCVEKVFLSSVIAILSYVTGIITYNITYFGSLLATDMYDITFSPRIKNQSELELKLREERKIGN